MSETWQYQVRVYLSDDAARTAREFPDDPALAPLSAVLSRHNAALKCQYDAFAGYVAETEACRLWEFEVTAPGQIRRQPWPSPNGGRLLAGPGGYQRFDSLAVDAGGNVCVATLINGGITVVSADGERLEHLPIRRVRGGRKALYG